MRQPPVHATAWQCPLCIMCQSFLAYQGDSRPQMPASRVCIPWTSPCVAWVRGVGRSAMRGGAGRGTRRSCSRCWCSWCATWTARSSARRSARSASPSPARSAPPSRRSWTPSRRARSLTLPLRSSAVLCSIQQIQVQVLAAGQRIGTLQVRCARHRPGETEQARGLQGQAQKREGRNPGTSAGQGEGGAGQEREARGGGGRGRQHAVRQSGIIGAVLPQPWVFQSGLLSFDRVASALAHILFILEGISMLFKYIKYIRYRPDYITHIY